MHTGSKVQSQRLSVQWENLHFSFLHFTFLP